MSEINLRHELVAQGYSSDDVARLVRDGQLIRLRRGAYVEPLAPDTTRRIQHRAQLTATLRQVSDEAIVSHASAAVLHGLPTWSDQLRLVHVTRDRAGGGKRRSDLHVHGTPIEPDDITTIGGIRVTNLARTVVDLGCSETLERSVSVGDAALRLGLRDDDVRQAVEAARGRHGIARVRCAAGLIDPLSESPGESFSRVRFWRWGLPTPILQFSVRDHRGLPIAWCDFGWPQLRTVGEFDGDVKYGALLKPGQTAQQAILDEKRREERIRELGWQVVRWSWADLSKRAELVGRLEAAFRRGQATQTP